MTFQITQEDVEREAGWNSHYYGLTPQKALQTEAAFILSGKYIKHLDSPQTEAWLRQFFPETAEEVKAVKERFQKIQDNKVQTDADREARDAAWDAYMTGL